MIAVVALLVFGPRRLPEIARTAGRAMAEFRRATRDLTSDLRMEFDEIPPMPRPESFRRPESDAASQGTPPSPPAEEPRPGPRA